MNQLGMGVMIHRLAGSSDGIESSVGKRIRSVTLEEESNGGNGAIVFWFEDGTGLHVYDDGQSCCEVRYMRTDDDLTYYAGSVLQGAEVTEQDETSTEWGEVHEAEFLHFKTDKGVFTVQTHNEHNGYYGGFAVVCKVIDKEATQ